MTMQTYTYDDGTTIQYDDGVVDPSSTGPSTGSVTGSENALPGMTSGTTVGGQTSDPAGLTSGLVSAFNAATGLNLTGSQLAGLGLGAATLAGSLSTPAYNPKSASQLLSQQPSNTPGAFTQAQMSAMQVPIKSGNQIQRTSAAAMPSSITPGVGALTQAPRSVQPYQFNSAVSNPITIPPKKFAEGGEVPGNGPLTQAQPFVGYVSDDSGGQADLIDAKLSGGEYVFDAESVAMLGDGNNAAGAAKLDQLREELRAQKRAAPNGEIAPPAQGALSYMKGGA
jgi:hypothetical protein